MVVIVIGASTRSNSNVHEEFGGSHQIQYHLLDTVSGRIKLATLRQLSAERPHSI